MMKRLWTRLLDFWLENYLFCGAFGLFLSFCIAAVHGFCIAAVHDIARIQAESTPLLPCADNAEPAPLPACADKAEALTSLGGASCRADQWGSIEHGPEGSVVLLCTCGARP